MNWLLRAPALTNTLNYMNTDPFLKLNLGISEMLMGCLSNSDLPVIWHTQVGIDGHVDTQEKWMPISGSSKIIRRKGWLFNYVLCVCMCVKPLQLCPTLCDPVDCSPPGSSVHGILQATGVGCHALILGIFLTQGSNPCLWHWPVALYNQHHLESPSFILQGLNSA